MIYSLFVLLLGACVGSFLNVCIFRLPLKKSIVFPGSACPSCSAPIKWYQNIPVLSYIFLRGKCASCSSRISFRYPLVEALTAGIFLILFYQQGFSFAFLKFAFFFCLLIVMSFIDIDYHAIPMYLSVLGVSCGIVFSFAETCVLLYQRAVWDTLALPLTRSFIGLIVGFGFAYLFKFFGDAAVSTYLSWKNKESIDGETESLGLGDIDFLGMVGVFFGWKAAVLTFFLAPFCAIIYTVAALILKRSHVIPYLPYLSLAALIVFLWGNDILRLFYL